MQALGKPEQKRFEGLGKPVVNFAGT